MQITRIRSRTPSEMQRPPSSLTDLYQSILHCKLLLGPTEFDLYIIRFLRTRDLPPVRRQNNRRKVVSPPGVAVGGGRTKKNRGVFNWRRQDPGRKRIPRSGRVTGGALSLFAFHTFVYFSYHFSLSYTRIFIPPIYQNVLS